MENIKELEKKLLDAKKEEYLNNLEKQLIQVKEEFEGKCYATNTLDRQHSALSVSATYYEKIFIKEEKIYVLEQYISTNRHDSYYKHSKVDASYTRYYRERCITDNEHHASYNIDTSWSHFKHEISLDLFKQIWNKGDECNLILREFYNGKLNHIKQDYITQGDFSNERSIENDIKTLNLDIIDFKNFPEVHSCIEYVTLPMFQERRWMPIIFAEQLLNYQVNIWKKELQDNWWMNTNQRSYVERKIKIVSEFIINKLQ